MFNYRRMCLIDLYLRTESPNGESDFQHESGALWLRSTNNINTFRVPDMEELVGSGLPLSVVHPVWRDIEGFSLTD